MKETLYEINWHYCESVFYRCTVTPIKVLRRGVLPGCSGVTITATDSSGRKFQASPDMFFATEEEAWAAVKEDISESIEADKKEVAMLKAKISAKVEFLKKIPSSGETK